jgi:hypothetical protein
MPSKLESIMRQDLSYCDPDLKNRFIKEAKSALRALAKQLSLSRTEYNLSANKGGIAGSGDVILHTDNFYISISQNMLGNDHEIMMRKCDSRTDYTGGRNHWAPIQAINNISLFAEHIRMLIMGRAKTYWVDEQVRSDVAHIKTEWINNPALNETQKRYENGEIEIEDFEHAVSVSLHTNDSCPFQQSLF